MAATNYLASWASLASKKWPRQCRKRSRTAREARGPLLGRASEPPGERRSPLEGAEPAGAQPEAPNGGGLLGALECGAN